MNASLIIILPRLGSDAEDHPVLSPFLGNSLLERHVRSGRRLGMSDVYLVADSEADTVIVKEFLSARGIDAPQIFQRDGFGYAASGEVLVLQAGYVVEEPVLRKLIETAESTAMIEGSEAEAEIAVPVAAWFSSEDVHQLLPDFLSECRIPDGVKTLRKTDLPSFNPGLRRHRRSGWARIEVREDLAIAKRMLIDGAQKGSLDVPAKYLHAPLENAAVSRVAESRVTPNQITLVTTAAAWIVTGLILAGHVWIGLLGAAVIGILDGVDGKLARLKLMTSRLGEMEHLLDMLFEYSWWLALGWVLGGGETGGPLFWMAVGLVVCSFVDTLAGVVFWVFRGSKTGRTIDNYTEFDLKFRLIAGRRNIYIWMMLLLGPVTGLQNAFITCFAWAVITVIVRLSRALLHIFRPRDDRLGSFNVA